MCLIVIILILLHLSTQTLRIYGGHDSQLGFLRQFDLSRENNIPTWFSSSMLLACSVLLGLIGWAKRAMKPSNARAWLALAAIFLFLSMDEASSLHEMTAPAGAALLKRIGLFNTYLLYSWLPFGIAAVAIIGLLYLPFLEALPKPTRRGFLLAGCVYVSGAVIAEMAGNGIDASGGRQSMLYAVQAATEEGLEMLGIVAFIYALLMYLRREDVSTAVAERLQHVFSAGDEETSPAAQERNA